MPPLDLLADIEDKLQIECTPLSWPIGMGKGFRGVYNLYAGRSTSSLPDGIPARRRASSSPISAIAKLDEFWAARPGNCGRTSN